MIKANELRIGNKVKMKVSTSVDNDWFETTIEVADLLGIENCDRLCTGIPLTPEILERCGFENYDNFNNGDVEFYRLNGLELQFLMHIGQFPEFVYIDNITKEQKSITIKYLHQLQNFYALTGTELEVKQLELT